MQSADCAVHTLEVRTKIRVRVRDRITREREREIYLHNAGNQKGFSPSKLVPMGLDLPPIVGWG